MASHRQTIGVREEIDLKLRAEVDLLI
jgi:hypothetical protein